MKPGDLVVAAGGRTGRDGVHGATFSSAPLEKGITSSVVQIGHAIMEKKTMDVLLQARTKKLYRGITDCGAGGFSSAIGELGKDTGVRVDLEKAPLKYPGLQPWEIWISESQERMVFAVPPENWQTLRTLFQQENVEAVVLGEFTDDKRLTVRHNGETIVDLDMAFLHDGAPKLRLEAKWDTNTHRQRYREENAPVAKAGIARDDAGGTLKALLTHPIVASKESVVRQYDHEVQGGSVVKPFMGPDKDGPTDACVFRPKLTSWRGVAVSNGMTPELGKWDPYLMAKFSVDEAYRNLIAVGGGLKTAAILDNFCWGDQKNAHDLAGLVRAAEGAREAAVAYGLPFISGKDSFHNTWRAPDGRLHSIPPTLLISAIGVIDDVRACVTPGFKAPDNLVYLVGETRAETRASLAASLWGDHSGKLPGIRLSESRTIYKKLQGAMKHRLILACHDISDGGLAVTAAEMAFGSLYGVELELQKKTVDLPTQLFGETPSRLLVEVSPMNKEAFEQAMGLLLVELVGKTSKKHEFGITFDSVLKFREPVPALKDLWKGSLKGL